MGLTPNNQVCILKGKYDVLYYNLCLTCLLSRPVKWQPATYIKQKSLAELNPSPNDHNKPLANVNASV